MNEPRLDITSEPNKRNARLSESQPDQPQRKFVGMQFDCCGSYARIYINREETAYTGNCPRCGRSVSLKIGPGGTDSRFFRVS